ncbi:hypothetical protein AAG570_007024 [Ranatra chinensis]|uniref:Reverse transcriptase/retrotransposon-derived protein RNase H-like domain-containing protein n=1 Tax=Ranatra chinensis TaxID=642074 RepID=A0ABD0Z8E4_9HEMI
MFVYIEDILVSSVDHKQHEFHLREVIRRLAKRTNISLQKCPSLRPGQFSGLQDFFFRNITKNLDEIKSYPRPETVDGHRKFLGMVNFYRSLTHAAETLKELNKYLQGSKNNDLTPVIWFEAAAFDKTEQSQNLDASDIGVGAVLQQHDQGTWIPPGFFSTTLTEAQQKYSIGNSWQFT